MTLITEKNILGMEYTKKIAPVQKQNPKLLVLVSRLIHGGPGPRYLTKAKSRGGKNLQTTRTFQQNRKRAFISISSKAVDTATSSLGPSLPSGSLPI